MSQESGMSLLIDNAEIEQGWRADGAQIRNDSFAIGAYEFKEGPGARLAR